MKTFKSKGWIAYEEMVSEAQIKNLSSEVIKDLDELGAKLYSKFGTDSYEERCFLHDIKSKLSKIKTHE